MNLSKQTMLKSSLHFSALLQIMRAMELELDLESLQRRRGGGDFMKAFPLQPLGADPDNFLLAG